jgi:hypothetical protein
MCDKIEFLNKKEDFTVLNEGNFIIRCQCKNCSKEISFFKEDFYNNIIVCDCNENSEYEYILSLDGIAKKERQCCVCGKIDSIKNLIKFKNNINNTVFYYHKNCENKNNYLPTNSRICNLCKNRDYIFNLIGYTDINDKIKYEHKECSKYLTHNDTFNLFKNYCYIYYIKCSKTNKLYIGSTTNLKTRLNTHFTELSKNKHKNKELQSDYNLYGISNFKFGILELLDFKLSDELKHYEQFYYNKYKKYDLYNKLNPILTPKEYEYLINKN